MFQLQKGFGLIGILLVVGIIAVLGIGALKMGFPDRNPFVPTNEEKSAIKQAEDMKNLLEQKNNDTIIPNTVADETKDWNTYRNEEYGFEFRYPPYFNLKYENIQGSDTNFEKIFQVKVKSVLRLESELNQSFINIDIISGKSLEEFIAFESRQEIINTWYYDSTPPELLKNLTVSGRKGMLRRGPGQLSNYNGSHIMVENDKNQIIQLDIVAQEPYIVIENILSQIFSTFKFTQ